jgi:hypothetical protein
MVFYVSTMSDVKVMLSTSTFWFWNQPYDPLTSIHLIKKYDLPLDGVDIWFFATKDSIIPEFDQATIEFLNSMELLSVHTDFYDYNWRGEVDFNEFRQRLRTINNMCLQLGARDFTVHADFLIRYPEQIMSMLKTELPNVHISFEFMDKEKIYGNHPNHFKDIFKKDTSFGLVMDLAHLQDFLGEFDWTDFFYDPFLENRITYVHASNHAHMLQKNFYSGLGFKNMNAVHVLCKSDISLFSNELLDECRKYPIVIEGIIPPGEVGIELLLQEIHWLKKGGL